MDAMRKYLDAIREPSTSATRKRPASVPLRDMVRPAASSRPSGDEASVWDKLEEDVDDLQMDLTTMDTSIDRIQGRLENIDGRLEQFFASRQSRGKLATLALKVFECHICHLFFTAAP
jgi:hypothetical protein